MLQEPSVGLLHYMIVTVLQLYGVTVQYWHCNDALDTGRESLAQISIMILPPMHDDMLLLKSKNCDLLMPLLLLCDAFLPKGWVQLKNLVVSPN